MSSNRLYDRISRDPALGELRDGQTRLFLMRADAFMDAFKRLDDDARYTMFAAFAESVAEHSGQSVKHYRHELGPAAREIFLNAAVNLAADMGWGGWRFGPHTPGEMTLDVANSPVCRGARTVRHSRLRPDPRADGSPRRDHLLGRSPCRGDRMRGRHRRRYVPVRGAGRLTERHLHT
jgi:hypothetical protein